MLYGGDAWLVKEEDAIVLERTGKRWSDGWAIYMISVEKSTTRLKLSSMWQYVQNRRL